MNGRSPRKGVRRVAWWPVTERVPQMVALLEPRPLTERERAFLLFHAAGPAGTPELVVQVDNAQVVSTCDCGCGTVGLAVGAGAPGAHWGSRKLWASAGGVDVNLTIDDGYLGELEIWSSWEGPAAPPAVEALRHDWALTMGRMRIAIAADEDTGIAGRLADALRTAGHDVVAAHGALNPDERDDWAWASEAAARDVAAGRADQAVICCWTGTGASIAANKVRGIRAALCTDAKTAAGAREWNDANVLALSLRLTSEASLKEILDAWFDTAPSTDEDDRANIAHLDEIQATR